MLSTPTVEMLWEPVDPHAALTRRFKFADAGQLAAWVTEALADTWGVEVISCDRVVISAGNALVWLTSSTGRMIFKWSVRSSLFARLANVARLTSWLDGRGLPVSAPLPALNGDLQVERNGFSIGLQSIVNGSMLDSENRAQVHAAGVELARLHLALADYPDAGPLGPGDQADSTPLRTRVEGWLHSAGGDHVAPLGESLRRRLASLPSDTTLPAPQLVHLDIRSANLLCDGDRISAILDFEEAGIDHPVDDLAKAVVLLGTRFKHWGPVPPETQATFVAGYRAVRELSSPEAAWLGPLILWRTLRLVPVGGNPTGWAESAHSEPASRCTSAITSIGSTRRVPSWASPTTCRSATNEQGSSVPPVDAGLPLRAAGLRWAQKEFAGWGTGRSPRTFTSCTRSGACLASRRFRTMRSGSNRASSAPTDVPMSRSSSTEVLQAEGGREDSPLTPYQAPQVVPPPAIADGLPPQHPQPYGTDGR